MRTKKIVVILALVIGMIIAFKPCDASAALKTTKGRATNGTYTWYVWYDITDFSDTSKGYLIRKNNKTGSEKTVKTLPHDGYICTTRGDNIYITVSDGSGMDGYGAYTYTYNIKTGKLWKAANSIIIGRSGSYVTCQDTPTSDPSPYGASIYRLTSKGMSRVKKLGKSCNVFGKVYKKRFYFLRIAENKICFYSIGVNGKDMKKLATFKAKDGCYLECEITTVSDSPKYIEFYVYARDNNYESEPEFEASLFRYTFSTEKLDVVPTKEEEE